MRAPASRRELEADHSSDRQDEVRQSDRMLRP
jgi:hypothetical protein